jgi:hypothetical protein
MTTSPLRFVTYTTRHTGQDLTADLGAIRARSTVNNQRDGITGALVYDCGRFVQAFEGPPQAVSALLARVSADARCGEPEVLIDQPVNERSLPEWSMHILRTDTEMGLDAAALRQLRDAYVRSFLPDAAGFVTVIRALVRG